MRFWIVFAALLLLPASAWGWTKKCDGTGGSVTAIRSGERFFGQRFACFVLDTAGTVDSTGLTVAGPGAEFCIDPDTSTDGAGTHTVFIRKCIGDEDDVDDNHCVTTTDSALTGAGGSPSTQLSCVSVGPGVYFVDHTASGAQTGYVSARSRD